MPCPQRIGERGESSSLSRRWQHPGAEASTQVDVDLAPGRQRGWPPIRTKRIITSSGAAEAGVIDFTLVRRHSDAAIVGASA